MVASSIKPLPALERPIIVVGYMHSGTTLLLKILGNHSTIFSGGGETKFFDYLPMIRRTYPNLSDEAQLRDFLNFTINVVRYGYKITDVEANRRASDVTKEAFEAMLADARKSREHGAIFRIVSDHLTQMNGKTRWLEKTPTHVFQIDTIIESVPDVLFVEIVRDPRDVLASKKTRRQTVWGTSRYTDEQRPMKHLEKAYDPLWDALSWKSAVRAGAYARQKYPGRVFTIRYEDLVAEPERQIQAVCQFLSMKYEPSMLDVSTRNSAERGDSEKEGIATDSVGRWRRTLDGAEVALCQTIVKNELRSLRYPPAPTSLLSGAKLPLLATRSSFEFGQRLFRRWRLGGTAYSANVLLIYWKRFRRLVQA